MKGQTNIYWTMGAFLVIIVTILVFLETFPRINETIAQIVSKTSSEAVSRQLSNLISVSAAAPFKAEIFYNPTKEGTYTISSESRVLYVNSHLGGKEFKQLTSKYPFLIPLKDFSYNNVNYFIIYKENGKYVFKAKKV